MERRVEEYKIEIETKEKTVAPNKSNREKIQKKIDRLTDLFINGMIGMDDFRKRKSELDAQLEEEPEPVKKDLTAVNAFLSSGLLPVYHTLTPEEKQSLWRSAVQEIRIKDKEILSVRFL